MMYGAARHTVTLWTEITPMDYQNFLNSKKSGQKLCLEVAKII